MYIYNEYLDRFGAFELKIKIYHFVESFGGVSLKQFAWSVKIILNDKNQFKLSQLKLRAESSLSDIKFIITYSEGGKVCN